MVLWVIQLQHHVQYLEWKQQQRLVQQQSIKIDGYVV